MLFLSARERLHHVDFAVLADRHVQAIMVANALPIHKHENVLAEMALVIEHIVPSLGLLQKHLVQRGSERAGLDFPFGAIHMALQVRSEVDARHRNSLAEQRAALNEDHMNAGFAKANPGRARPINPGSALRRRA